VIHRRQEGKTESDQWRRDERADRRGVQACRPRPLIATEDS
jgi:hypothetical protein